MNILRIIRSQDSRTIKAQKSIIGLTVLKGTSIIINLSLIPLTLDLLDPLKYGLWITIITVFNWINIFDIGLGNGLRNECAKAFAQNDYTRAKYLISSAYALLFLIITGILIVLGITWSHINWYKAFNTTGIVFPQLNTLLIFVVFSLAISFVVKLITNILTADHKPAIASSIYTISNLIILLLFLVFPDFYDGSILRIGLTYVSIPLGILTIVSIILFTSTYKQISPNLAYVNNNYFKDLLGIGSQFFIIQIAVLIVFQTDNFIITHVLSPSEVTPYSIIFRYFGIIIMGFNLFLTPLWSAYTDAYTRMEYSWLKKTFQKTLYLLTPTTFLIFAFLIFAKKAIRLWIQQDLLYTDSLLIGMAIYAFINVWNNIFAYFLNGIGKIKIQIWTSIFAAIINIPLSIVFARLWGNSGVIFASNISLLFFAILGPIQTMNLFKKFNQNLFSLNHKA